ncbi:adenosylcobinamide-GDP ribazoletransferase [Sporosalibacterium faouarense]|uniref:adenosylcobinamide-GDP ribazoletransferase n=1 Tax=Sporosalibacterium faouarense TaxID=516123 RepID=UPI00192B81AE|nr:adenosylcobinamide-GDP ribazoletransferase [Sporosalibacterium faouarense]
MRSLLLMIVFFTRIPIKYKWDYRDKDLKKGIALFPMIGLIIGTIIWLPSLLKDYIDKPIIILISWLLYLWITGGLHIDGLADTFDGIFSNRSKERMLEIMKDSRIGTFGVLGIVFIVISNLVISNYIDYTILILVPIVGRFSAILAASISKYARKETGMGTTFITSCGLKHVILGLLFTVICATLIDYKIAVITVITYIFVIIQTKYIENKIGGMTGDTVGYIIEISQTIFMVSIYFFRGLII